MEKFLLRAKVEEWEHIEGRYVFRWAEGYLNLEGITEKGPVFSFAELEKGTCISHMHTRKNGERYVYKPMEHSHYLKDTVSRWTGLLDKDGKKIWEGDVVKTEYGRLCVVEWFESPNFCGWDLFVVNTVENCLHTKAPDTFSIWNKNYLEVVGNKWDDLARLEGRE